MSLTKRWKESSSAFKATVAIVYVGFLSIAGVLYFLTRDTAAFDIKKCILVFTAMLVFITFFLWYMRDKIDLIE